MCTENGLTVRAFCAAAEVIVKNLSCLRVSAFQYHAAEIYTQITRAAGHRKAARIMLMSGLRSYGLVAFLRKKLGSDKLLLHDGLPLFITDDLRHRTGVCHEAVIVLSLETVFIFVPRHRGRFKDIKVESQAVVPR